jgi:hypothetical protein
MREGVDAERRRVRQSAATDAEVYRSARRWLDRMHQSRHD